MRRILRSLRCTLMLAVIIGFAERTLAIDQTTPLRTHIEDTGDAVRIIISAANTANGRLFVLGEPNRVVIDLPGIRAARRDDLVPPPNPLIETVRFGIHPDKTRIVADIKSTDIPPPTLEAIDGGIVITLAVSPETRAAFLSANAVNQPVVATPQEHTLVPPQEPEISVGQKLTAVTFERASSDGGPTVRLALTERPTFSFQKADPKTYRLTLNKCTVGGAHLAFPQFPPDDFSGFTLIEVRQTGENTEVLIGVDDDHKIAPTSTEHAVLIRSLPRG